MAVKIGSYVLGKTLGVGSFGKVKLAQHEPSGIRVAIKILNRKKIQSLDMDEKVRREIKTLKLFAHPHITRLYEVIDTPTDIFVVMEYVSEGELFDFIVEKGRLSEGDARRFFQQFISGVEYCHRHMVVHRDLKPENLLLDQDFNLKIADFGLSNMMRDGYFLKTSCGSPNYAAPEVISGKLYAGPEVDVWSCGVILYALLCGSLPFDDENIPNLFKKIKGGIYSLPSYISEGVRDLIPRMLVVDPMKRITVAEIQRHAWFRHNLPKYLAVTADDRLVESRKADAEALGKVITIFQTDAAQARRDIETPGVRNEVTVAYSLILDTLERQRRNQSQGGLLDDITRNMSSGSDLSTLDEGAALDGPRIGAVPAGPEHAGAGAAMMAADSDGGVGSSAGSLPAPPIGAPIPGDVTRWQLGKVVSTLGPAAIMAQVYQALAAVGATWKTITPYSIKCLHEMPLHPDGRGGAFVKMIVQLYKLPDGKYLIDFHKTSGSLLCFAESVKALSSHLRCN